MRVLLTVTAMKNKANSHPTSPCGPAGRDGAGRPPVAQPPSAVEFRGPPPRAGVLHVCSGTEKRLTASLRTRPPAGGNCAKRTQFAGDAGWDEAWRTATVGSFLALRPWGLRPPWANRAKRSQFLDCGFRIADCGLRTDLRGTPPRPAAPAPAGRL